MRNRTTQLKQFRNELIILAWLRYKNQLTMEELAGFFNISLKSIYRIIKAEYKSKSK